MLVHRIPFRKPQFQPLDSWSRTVIKRQAPRNRGACSEGAIYEALNLATLRLRHPFPHPLQNFREYCCSRTPLSLAVALNYGIAGATGWGDLVDYCLLFADTGLADDAIVFREASEAPCKLPADPHSPTPTCRGPSSRCQAHHLDDIAPMASMAPVRSCADAHEFRGLCPLAGP